MRVSCRYLGLIDLLYNLCIVRPHHDRIISSASSLSLESGTNIVLYQSLGLIVRSFLNLASTSTVVISPWVISMAASKIVPRTRSSLYSTFWSLIENLNAYFSRILVELKCLYWINLPVFMLSVILKFEHLIFKLLCLLFHTSFPHVIPKNHWLVLFLHPPLSVHFLYFGSGWPLPLIKSSLFHVESLDYLDFYHLPPLLLSLLR